jgi:hypothetical protein
MVNSEWQMANGEYSKTAQGAWRKAQGSFRVDK